MAGTQLVVLALSNVLDVFMVIRTPGMQGVFISMDIPQSWSIQCLAQDATTFEGRRHADLRLGSPVSVAPRMTVNH